MDRACPGLPKDVIEELSRRAREAERLLRSQRQLTMKNEKKARVRVATQPTFTRYVFELPDVIAVTSDRGADDAHAGLCRPDEVRFRRDQDIVAGHREGDRKF